MTSVSTAVQFVKLHHIIKYLMSSHLYFNCEKIVKLTSRVKFEDIKADRTKAKWSFCV